MVINTDVLKLGAIIILVIVVILIYYFRETLWFGTYNTTSIEVLGPEGLAKVKVHRAHSNPEDAAKLLAEINRRNQTLIEYLGKKYIKEPTIMSDPSKANRIDVIPSSELYNDSDMASGIANLMNNPAEHEYLQERIVQLMSNYSPQRMYEISPKNTGNATSYTEDKRILVLCLRQKKPDAQGIYELHDINTMMFVVLHELSHMMNNTWQHKLDFWVLFKFLLLNAIEAGIYTPVDYGKYPINYCGLWLHYNPLFDSTI